jgi:hypothetical protein
MANDVVVLRSPFNGMTIEIPPDFPSETLHYMEHVVDPPFVRVIPKKRKSTQTEDETCPQSK